MTKVTRVGPVIDSRDGWVAFDVKGLPIPQGSHRFVRGRIMDVQELAGTLGPWRDSVGLHARAALADAGIGVPITEPVAVSMVFRLPQPGRLPRGRLLPAVRPDLDKLARAVLDALSRCDVWVDDGQVVALVIAKVYATISGDNRQTIALKPVHSPAQALAP